MKITAAKAFRALCGMMVMLVLAAGITSLPVLAASNGIYIATASPHYKHPVTGKVEDSGGEGSAVLGQSMTDSATYNKALVEVDPSGNTFITVRLKLMDNIQDPKFQVDGKAVSSELMQEDYTANTADFRMKVNSENSIIRCNMYVVPMGREVIFFITVSDLRTGSEDFITKVKVNSAASSSGNQTKTPSDANAKTPAESSAAAESAPADTAEAVSNVESSVSAENSFAESLSDEVSAAGLEEFDASGNLLQSDAEAPKQNAKKSSAIWWVLGGAALLAAAGLVWYFCFFRKKDKRCIK